MDDPESGLVMTATTLAVLDDPENLPGGRVAEVLESIAKLTGTGWVLLSRVEGSGEAFPTLSELEGQGVELSRVLMPLQDVTQMDWGDFFLMAQPCESPEIFLRLPLGEQLEQAAVLVRAVDGGYLYCYMTGQEEVVEALARSPLFELSQVGPADLLPFPD